MKNKRVIFRWEFLMVRVMGLILTVGGADEVFVPALTAGLRDSSGSYSTGFTALILLSVTGTIAVDTACKKSISKNNSI